MYRAASGQGAMQSLQNVSVQTGFVYQGLLAHLFMGNLLHMSIDALANLFYILQVNFYLMRCGSFIIINGQCRFLSNMV